MGCDSCRRAYAPAAHTGRCYVSRMVAHRRRHRLPRSNAKYTGSTSRSVRQVYDRGWTVGGSGHRTDFAVRERVSDMVSGRARHRGSANTGYSGGVVVDRRAGTTSRGSAGVQVSGRCIDSRDDVDGRWALGDRRAAAGIQRHRPVRPGRSRAMTSEGTLRHDGGVQAQRPAERERGTQSVASPPGLRAVCETVLDAVWTKLSSRLQRLIQLEGLVS